MAHKAPQIPEDVWNDHKANIQALYLTENRKLLGSNGLIHTMATVHSLYATKAQFESQLKKWGFVKNRKRDEWNILGRKIEQRAQEGKNTILHIDGKLVSAKRVQRQITRHKSSFEPYPEASSPKIPNGFAIKTPEPEDVIPNMSSRFSPSWVYNIPFLDIEFDLQYHVAHEIIVNDSGRSAMIQPVDFIDPKVLHTFQTIPPGSIRRQHLHTANFPGKCLGINSSPTPNVTSSFRRSLLPMALVQYEETQNNNMYLEDLPKIHSRLTMFSVANDRIDLCHDHKIVLLECLKSPRNMEIFYDSRYNQRPEMEAFVEKLFGIAIQAEDVGLVEFLLKNTTLDPNKLILSVYGTRLTPIERASSLQNAGLAKVLLDAGADIHKTFKPWTLWEGELRYQIKFRYSNEWYGALRMAIGHHRGPIPPARPVSLELIRLLLDAGAQFDLEALAAAISQRNANLVELLINSRVETCSLEWIRNDILAILIETCDEEFVLNTIKKIARVANLASCFNDHKIFAPLNYALNQAALRGSFEIFQFLLDCNAQITVATLVNAVSSCNLKLIQFLLKAGVDVGSFIYKSCSPMCRMNDSKGILFGVEAVQNGCGGRFDKGNHPVTTPLAKAILSKDPQVLHLLLENGAWSQMKEMERFRAALDAVSEVGDIQLARDLLKVGADFKANDLWWSIMLAIENKHGELALLLLDQCPDPWLRSYPYISSRLPLELALMMKDPKLVRMLLELGVSPRYSLNSTLPAIILATLWGDHQIVQDLIDMSADIDCFYSPPIMADNNNYSYKSALTISIEMGDQKLTRILLDAGADVSNFDCDEITFKFGSTALATAISISDELMIDELLSKGAEPNDSKAIIAAIACGSGPLNKILDAYVRKYPGGKKGFATGALVIAIRENDLELTEKLLAIKSDVNYIVRIQATNERGHNNYEKISPLGEALTGLDDCNLRIVERLLDVGGNPNSIVYKARLSHESSASALLAAIKSHSPLTVQLLISAGADVNRPARLRIQRTPLQLAAQLGNFDIVQILLKAGANVNGEPAVRGGATALQLAAIEGYAGIADLLLSHGALPNAPAGKVEGRTALEGAAEWGRIHMIKLLYNAGARMNQKQFERARNFAEENGHFAVKKFLGTLFAEFLSMPQQPSVPSFSERGSIYGDFSLDLGFE